MSLEFEHFIGYNPIPQGALFHPDGQQYVFSAGALVVVGDLLDPHRQDFLRTHDDTVSALALSPSGRLLASGQRGENADICVWDIQTRSRLYKLEEHDFGVDCLAFSHDDKLLVSCGSAQDGNLIFWDTSNGCIVSSARVPAGTLCLAFNGFARDIKRRDLPHYQLFSAGSEGIVQHVLDPYTGEIQTNKLTADARATLSRVYTSLSFSQDRETLFASTTSGDFVVASVKALRVTRTVSATRMRIHCIATTFSQSPTQAQTQAAPAFSFASQSERESEANELVLLGCGDSTVKITHAHSGEMRASLSLDGPVLSLSLSQDHCECLASTATGSILRINLRSGEYIVISEAHTERVVQVVFDKGEERERCATVCADQTIKVWDLSEYNVIATARARREQPGDVQPLCVQFANLLFSGWSDGRIVAHSAETGESLWSLDNAHASGVSALALSHNRRFLLSGGPQGEVRLWEMRSRELISHLKEHKQKVTCLQLFSDDTLALSGSRDRCILRWDLRNEKRAHCHMQRMGGINQMVLTRDDRFIVSVGQDRKLVLWDNTRNDPLFSCALDEENDEGLAIAISNDGRYVITGGTAGVLRVWALDAPHGLRFLSTQHAHSKPITSVAFSPSDKQVVSVGEDGCIFVWWFYPQ